MILVNGTEIQTYDLDTTKSIQTRIAAGLETLPKYLYFSEPFEYDPEKVQEIKVNDILRLIKKDASRNTNIGRFLSDNERFLKPFQGKNFIEDVVKPWLAYNTAIEQAVSTGGDIFLTSIGMTLTESEYFPNPDAFEDFWTRDRHNFRVRLESYIGKEVEENENMITLYEMFQSITDGKGYTDFKVTEVLLKIYLQFQNSSLLELFNSLKLQDAIPFCSCQDYYKILKGYTPYEKWAKPSETLSMKVNSKVSVNRNMFKDYVDVDLVPQEDNVFVTNVNLIFESSYLNRENFLKRLISPFKEPPKIQKTEETEITAIFYFPEFRVDTYVFSDLVMNDKVFSRLITIDESVKATKKKGEYGQPWLYIHFNHPSIGHVSASIAQKLVDRSDPEMRDQDLEIFEHGRPYIRVRATAMNKASMKGFQEVLSKLFVLYETNYPEIVEAYQRFIPDFGTVYEEAAPLKKKVHELLAPKVFVKNYSRNCPEYRIPTIVDSEGDGVMKYPRDSSELNDPPYPSDGVSQHYYSCMNTEYPHIGLQKNKLPENRDAYPYVPCCFKTEQMGKPGGYYRHYYFGDPIESREKKQQDLIVTNKFLDSGKYGVLPDELIKFFDLLDMSYEGKYIRIGVSKTPSSFLQAVMTALGHGSDIDGIRQELAGPSIVPMGRQCAYELESKQLSEKILDKQSYFDPSLFVQLLEGYFNCNIFLFNSSGMFLPNFRQNYYRNNIEGPCVFVYEHWGSESDHAQYPQCELIGKWGVKEVQYYFDKSEGIAQSAMDIFRVMNNSYALSKQVRDVTFALPETIKVTGQGIDSYGKTRRLECTYGKIAFTVLTDPIPPMPVPEVSVKPVNPCPLETCLSVFGPISEEGMKQTIHNGMVSEIVLVVRDITLAIPVIPEAPLDDLPVSDESIHYIETSERKESKLEMYNRNKKLARYIFEYALWLFSKFIQDQQLQVIGDKELAQFAAQKIVIDPRFSYGKVEKRFSMDSGVMKGGKLAVQNEETLRRIMYAVKLYSMQDIRSLSTYFEKKFIVQYYVDLTDFDLDPNQVILQGEDSIDKWIQERNFHYTLYDEVAIGKRVPYFFKNLSISDQVFLAQNVDSLQMAYSIGYNWVKNGYNLSQASAQKVPENFVLYKYRGRNDIQKYMVGSEIDPIVQILGYKISGTPFYTVLLNIK